MEKELVEGCFSWGFPAIPKYIILPVPFKFGVTYRGRQMTQDLGMQRLPLDLAAYSLAAAEAFSSSAGEKLYTS